MFLPADNMKQRLEELAAVQEESHGLKAERNGLAGPLHIQWGQLADNVPGVLDLGHILKHRCDLCQAAPAAANHFLPELCWGSRR